MANTLNTSSASTTPSILSTPLEELIKSLEENKASPKEIAAVLADALYATDRKSEPDHSLRVKAAELLLKVNKLIGAGSEEDKKSNDSVWEALEKEAMKFVVEPPVEKK